MNFNLNQGATVSGEIRKVSDRTLVDPAQVRVKVQDPHGHITTYVYGVASNVTKLGTGLYQIELLLNKPGQWIVWFEGNSSNQASEQTTLFVDSSPFYDSFGDELPDS